MEFYPYKIENLDMLKDLEIIMLKEYHFNFPLAYAYSTKDIYISKQSPIILGDTKINKIRISPISLNIEGTSINGSHPIYAYEDCSIKLKDKTVLSNLKFGSCSYGNMNESLITGLPFENPIMLDLIEEIIIKSGNNVVEIPVKSMV